MVALIDIVDFPFLHLKVALYIISYLTLESFHNHEIQA